MHPAKYIHFVHKFSLLCAKPCYHVTRTQKPKRGQIRHGAHNLKVQQVLFFLCLGRKLVMSGTFRGGLRRICGDRSAV